MPTGLCKLLFLTGPQADLLASSNDSLQKMLDALEVPAPKLVINLLASQGFDEYVSSHGTGLQKDAAKGEAGMVYGRSAFLTMDEERIAEERIDQFMSTVLIPLAAQTNAVVIVNACPGDSILTRCLTRMYSVHRSKWSVSPFTIISATGGLRGIYRNPDLKACWRDVRKSSRTWRARDKKLLEIVHAVEALADGSLPERQDDLDANAEILLIVDGIEAKKEQGWDKAPFNALITNLVRYLSSSLPALTIKTGNGNSGTLAEAGRALSGLDVALNAANGGAPVLFLDVRERELIKASDRVALIAAAKASCEAYCDELLNSGLAESFICCSIAYFHGVLFDGMDDTEGTGIKPKSTVNNRLSLWEAIKLAEHAGPLEEGVQGMKGATNEQVDQVASWLAHQYFKDAFQVLFDKADREQRGETYQKLYSSRIHAMAIWTRSLLTSPNFHHVNLCDQDRAKRFVSQLVCLDRLPKSNPVEGLLLLQEAWKAHDITAHLADRYKFRSKLLFILQLLVMWTITLSTSLGDSRSQEAASGADCIQFEETSLEWRGCMKQQVDQLTGGTHLFAISVSYYEAAFFLSAVASILTSIDGILNAKVRWRHLRSCTGQLESMIWCYRTRVGTFELTSSDTNSRLPETNLRDTLITWRRDLMVGGDLQVSGLSQIYPPHVYTHHQFPECGLLRSEDDHFSPVQPNKYIEMRLLPSIAFYERRTPWYSCQRYFIKLVLLLCTLAATLLTRYELAVWVIGVSSSASALTSWQEYTDVARKTERYTRAAFELQNLLSWWKSLSEVEKASKVSISQLIHNAEGIISEERLAWMSTANKAHAMASHAVGPAESGDPGFGVNNLEQGKK